MVTAGLRHTAAILDDSSVRAWGYNAKGQLGIGTNESVGDEQDEMGDNLATTELGDTPPTYISAGGWHTCAIIEGNQLKCWGEERTIGATPSGPAGRVRNLIDVTTMKL